MEGTTTNKNNTTESQIIKKKELFWLDITQEKHLLSSDVVKTFDHDDIETSKPTPKHINKLIRKRYGKTSSKQNVDTELKIIRDLHDKVKTNFKNLFKASFEEIMVTVAIEIGMRDGKSKYSYGDIAKHVIGNPNYCTVCRLAFLMRGMFERHHRLKIKLEEKFMRILGFKYTNNFKSNEKSFGCFSNIISEVITNKHRDINSRLKRVHKFRIVQRSKIHFQTIPGRLRSDNKSFFSLLKNVQYEDENEKTIDEKIPEKLRYVSGTNNEVHFDILEGIVFPPGSLSKIFFIIGKWIGDLQCSVENSIEQNVKQNDTNYEIQEAKPNDKSTAKEDNESSSDEDVSIELSKTYKKGKRKKVVLVRKPKKKKRVIEESDSDSEYVDAVTMEKDFEKFLGDVETEADREFAEMKDLNIDVSKSKKTNDIIQNPTDKHKKELNIMEINLINTMNEQLTEINKETKNYEENLDQEKRSKVTSFMTKFKVS